MRIVVCQFLCVLLESQVLVQGLHSCARFRVFCNFLQWGWICVPQRHPRPGVCLLGALKLRKLFSGQRWRKSFPWFRKMQFHGGSSILRRGFPGGGRGCRATVSLAQPVSSSIPLQCLPPVQLSMLALSKHRACFRRFSDHGSDHHPSCCPCTHCPSTGRASVIFLTMAVTTPLLLSVHALSKHRACFRRFSNHGFVDGHAAQSSPAAHRSGFSNCNSPLYQVQERLY